MLKKVVGQAVFGDEGNKFTCAIIFFVKNILILQNMIVHLGVDVWLNSWNDE